MYSLIRNKHVVADGIKRFTEQKTDMQFYTPAAAKKEAQDLPFGSDYVKLP